MEGASELPALSKLQSRQAAKVIRKASTHLIRQRMMEDYLYSKLRPDCSASQNTDILCTKVTTLQSKLCPADAKQLAGCGNRYIQHLAGLLNQKKLLLQQQNSAAVTAFRAERTDNTGDAMKCVHSFMVRHVTAAQGPQARLNHLRAARSTVEAALAFPTWSGWSHGLDAFMQAKGCEGPVHGPQHSQLTAKQLNNASPHEVDQLADHYFYQKVVATWSAKANSSHIDNELQALLPQLQDELICQALKACAQFYMCHMSEICDVKQAQQQANWDVSCQAFKRLGRSSNDRWRLVMHSADSQNFASFWHNED